MYRIVVVDDELWFREGIKGSIQWSNYDIEIVGEACDGEEAIKVIERERPDIVFADIRMPVMDGLELASIVVQKYPEVRLIIVSGYEEFEYARKAMSLGVSYYLTKPVEAEQLVDIVNKVKEEIRRKMEDSDNRKRLEEQLKVSLPLLRDKFLNSLVNGEMRDIAEIRGKLEFLDIPFKLEQYLVFVIDIEDGHGIYNRDEEENRQITSISAFNILKEILGEESIQVFKSNTENIVGIATFSNCMNTAFININISKMLVRFKSAVQKQLRIPVTIGVSKVNMKWDRINYAYREAVEAIKHKLFLGKDQIIFYQDITVSNNENFSYSFIDREELMDALKLCDMDRVKLIFNSNLKELAKKSYLDIDYIQQIYLGVLGDILNIIYDTGEIAEKVLAGNPFKTLLQLSTLEDINLWLIKLCCSVSETIANLRCQRNRKAVQKIVEYIHKNYNKDISLNSAAEYADLSPAYLSRLFKKETSKSFIEFVMEIRVEKAKALLRDKGKKTYEVANEVGYSDIRYFTKMFKNFEGITPAQYREKF